MEACKTDPTPRLLLLARAAVLAVEERRKTDDADPRSTRPLTDAALEERARVLAELLGQAERRSADCSRPSTGSAAERALGASSGAEGVKSGGPTSGELERAEPAGALRCGPIFVGFVAPSSDLYRDDLRLEDGEDGATDLLLTEPWQDHPAEGV